MKAIHWDEKPWDHNTASRWRDLGYAVPQDAAPVGMLKTDYAKRKYPLYSFAQVIPLPGDKAFRSRWMWSYNRLKWQAQNRGKEWGSVRKVWAGWDKDQQDDAIYEESIKVESATYTDRHEQEMSLTITQREILRGEFEKAALEALGREYSSYPYGVGML